MKWVCPGCGSVHSIIDTDKEKWEGKQRCHLCPPLAKVVPKISFESLKSPQIIDLPARDSLVQQDVDVKSFQPERTKLGDVTDEPEQKYFRGKGYEGKKRGRRRK